jgi:molybdopterin synthase sulfur carrier subunit
MDIKVLCFGITKELLGGFEIEINLAEGATVLDLKNHLNQTNPQLSKLNSLRIALNEEYAEEHQVLKENDEIVLIPPVSGG